jgi:cephalosporin-C deacetylase-like acetyl esterase
MKKVLYRILFVCAFAINTDIFSQPMPPQINANVSPAPDEENLDVFQQWIRWNNPGSLLINHLIKQANIYYDQRDKEIAKLKSESDWLNRQANVKDKLVEIIGSFPQKALLNPRITGVLKKAGYQVEKVIFESMPGFYVTGCLYIPDGIKGRAPAVLNVIGHNQEAFRAELYQVIIYNLVKKGVIVFAIDPPGQGEHVQYYDPAINLSSIGYSVIEHCYFGNQCFLSGVSCARYFIWDGIRAIDYLLTRKEVDSERIGITGFSGGGTVASYIAALDGRVKVSVPCSWSNASRKLLETKGAQDAESVLYLGNVKGITFEDLLEVRAPKPTLLTFVSRDEYLCLQAARDAFNEAKLVYNVYGHPDNIKMVEDDSKHWMTPKIRSAIYAFFMHHFNIPGDPAEVEAETLSKEELKITSTGQISSSLGGDMIFDVNKKETLSLIENLEQSRKDMEKHLNNVQIKAKEISGYISLGNDTGEPFINGRYQRQGYTVSKYAIRGEGEYAIPVLLFVPSDNHEKYSALVYIHSLGKAAEAKTGGEIEKLVRQGYVVAAIDVLGIGETKNTAARGLTDGYTALLIGRSVVGIRAGDITRAVKFLKSLSEVDSSKIGAIGINEMCLPLLHAAAFNPSINNLVLIGSPISYRTIVMNRFYKIGLTERKGGGTWHPYEVDFSWGVAGVLTAYDLPDLIGCIAPRKLVLAGLNDQMLEPASVALIHQELEFPRSVYSSKNAGENLSIVSLFENLSSLVEWSFK